MLVCVLSSGSAGNSIYLESAGTRVLVDAGLSLRETARRCVRQGLRARDLDAVVLTHEHGDHACGTAVIARKLDLPVHATRGTFRGLREAPPEELRRIVHAGEPFVVGALRITPFALPHDAWEPVGFVFDDGSSRAAVVTDLGAVTAGAIAALQDLDALVLEFNHDVPLLLDGPYPWSLKKRIRGGHGHLSNEQGAHILRRVLHPGLRHLVLAHLSEHNNTERHARAQADQVLERAGARTRVYLGSQERALEPIEIRGAVRARQLALFA